ncbi:hypothetical protein AVEN_263833-1 [Araneus ventricosus]|uniref:Uncharacterized protein n=1 Tax=Araneus ventricosus TaxID=182803 RepID=A0A4Y2E1R0_ARAVE|nr:hypothetical protein AVEN_263833-1 [Araneus ventricosus]
MERIHEEMVSRISGEIKRDLLDKVCARNKQDNNQLIEEICGSTTTINSNSYIQVELRTNGIIRNPGKNPDNVLLIPKRSGIDAEYVILIRPKVHARQDYNVNKDLITKTLERKNSAARIRAINKINKGGVKIAVADENEVQAIKLSLESDNEISENFELYIPRRRIPQVIVYNIDKDIENEKDILDGILIKNIFLADKNNEPLVNVNFKIPARNPNFNHWVLSVSPPSSLL